MHLCIGDARKSVQVPDQNNRNSAACCVLVLRTGVQFYNHIGLDAAYVHTHAGMWTVRLSYTYCGILQYKYHQPCTFCLYRSQVLWLHRRLQYSIQDVFQHSRETWAQLYLQSSALVEEHSGTPANTEVVASLDMKSTSS